MDAVSSGNGEGLGLDVAGGQLSLGRQLTMLAVVASFATALGVARHETGPLAASGQAVRFLRDAARQDPARYLPDLAAALREHAAQLQEAGLLEKALTTVQDAVAVLQHVAGQDPAALPILADGLHDLAARLDACGRGRDAVTALEDTVTIRRHLARCLPERFVSDLATSLHALSQGLGAVGAGHEALATLTEAVAIRRLLADGDDRHRPHLATSLLALSIGLGSLGQLPEALAAGREAVHVYEQLAQHDPGTHVDARAGAVENLAISLAAMGLGAPGLTASEEAAALRHLARHNAQPDQLATCCCPCHASSTHLARGTIVETVAISPFC